MSLTASLLWWSTIALVCFLITFFGRLRNNLNKENDDTIFQTSPINKLEDTDAGLSPVWNLVLLALFGALYFWGYVHFYLNNGILLRYYWDWFVNGEFRQLLQHFLSGHHALASNANVVFHWDESTAVVGNTVSFTVKFFESWSRRPYPVSDADSIEVVIRQGNQRQTTVAAAVQIGGNSSIETNEVKASFTTRKAGLYNIEISIRNLPIKGSPFTKSFLPGPPEASKIIFIRPTSIIVCKTGQPHQLIIEPKDKYDNNCSWISSDDEQGAMESFYLEAFTVGSMRQVRPLVHRLWIELMRRFIIHVTFEEDGIFLVRLKFNEELIPKAEFNAIALSRIEAHQVEKAIGTKTPMYEVKLLSINGEKWIKNKKVFCFLSPKQIALKEYFLGVIPKRLATFRLCPTTKHEVSVFSIEDGAQLKVELSSKEGHLLAAAFAHYLLKNIGGSETFSDKQRFFYEEIRNFHHKKPHDKLLLRIDRKEIFQSSFKLTKHFSVNDWCKNFEINFIGEQGLDWGGLRREWIELLCVAIFDHSGMFTKLSDDNKAQSLVHPNSNIPASFKLKHYEFAGKLVGKCLYESSLGPGYRQFVKTRLTRSFLAMMIGLRVNYKYFEQDDPQLFLSKIKFIEDNDVSDMDLTFSEEEYDDKGQLIRINEFIPGGAHVHVTKDNKYQYLDALAQHRLVNSVKDQVAAFIDGLNTLVPDNLLSIFDENELELLMCGTSEFNVDDLKLHHVAIGSSAEFFKVLSWFWTAVSNFTLEERSRLLQFTTGSSLLPAGGLADLTPKFQITASPAYGSLPTAHTCFNQLCLPDYEDYEHFEKALLLAISEGTEGFGLT